MKTTSSEFDSVVDWVEKWSFRATGRSFDFDSQKLHFFTLLVLADNFAGSGPYRDFKSKGVQWTAPVVGVQPCEKQGVLSLYPPEGEQSVEIAFTFAEQVQGWLFNLGDSPYNNGHGENHDCGFSSTQTTASLTRNRTRAAD